MRVDRFRRFARGRPCQVRIPGVCGGDPATSVMCHLNGAGMGVKTHDIHAAIGCAQCHDALDGRVDAGYGPEELELMHLQAVIRTQAMMIEEGILTP